MEKEKIPTKQTIPTILLVGTSFIWGLTFVTQKLAGYHMGAFTYNAVRFILGALSLIPVFLIFEKTTTAKLKHTITAGIIGGAVLFIASNLQQFGIVLNKNPGSASEAGFITGLYLVFTPIIGLFFGRKTRLLTWLACIIAFFGLALISVGPEGISSIKLSDGLLVIGAVFWALHILVIDRYAPTVDAIRFTAVQFAVSAVLSTISAFAFETPTVSGIMDGIVPVLFGGIIACGTAYTLQIIGQRSIGPSKAAIIFSLEAVFAALSEVLFLNEFMTVRKYIGGAIIFLGIILTQWSENKPSRNDPPPHCEEPPL